MIFFKYCLQFNINITFSCQCSSLLLFGIARLRLSWKRMENRLYIPIPNASGRCPLQFHPLHICPYCLPHTAELQTRHLIQGRSNQMLRRKKNYWPAKWVSKHSISNCFPSQRKKKLVIYFKFKFKENVPMQFP